MYLVLKVLHVAAVVLFLGNIVTRLFWKAHGDRTRDPRIMAHTLEGIIRSDRLFTVPSEFLIVATGIAAVGGPWDPDAYRRLSNRWELWGTLATLTPAVAFVLMIFKH